MLVFGLLALGGGLVVGQRELVGVGVLLLALPPLAASTVLGASSRVVHSRTVWPVRVPVGHDARIQIRVGNSSRVWPAAFVSVADTLPVPLGEEPRYTVGHLGPRAVREVGYLVRPSVRGDHPIGPLRVTVTDALGCVRVERSLGAPSHLLVTPATVSLEAPSSADGAKGEESPRRPVSGVGEQDPVPREYRHGDELRRVHWKSTAKHGRLMVRRDEQHWRENSAILLDARRGAHDHEGPAGSLETAVSAAASVAVNLLDSGHDLSLHTERGRVPASTAAGVLDGLALVEPSDTTGLIGGIGLLGDDQGTTSLTVAVLGSVCAEETAALSRGGDGIRVAVLCAHAAWPDRETLYRTRDVLAAAGWRTIVLSSVAELPRMWGRVVEGTGGPASFAGGPASTASAQADPYVLWKGPR